MPALAQSTLAVHCYVTLAASVVGAHGVRPLAFSHREIEVHPRMAGSPYIYIGRGGIIRVKRPCLCRTRCAHRVFVGGPCIGGPFWEGMP